MDYSSSLAEKLGDRYRVERELGAGGAAVVYLAEDRKLHRSVAIKVLRPDVAAAVGPDRFLREIEIAERLQHPFILPLFDCGVSDGFFYYVMPYVEGESLRERLDRDGPFPIGEALKIAREVADALEFAHGHGVIHRDIKPENILLEGGHAVISDFGIARAVSEAGDERLTISGHSVGTPMYMSPEQARGDKLVDGRSDIYSLSCVLYEMLTGRPPFKGETVQAVIAGHLLESPTAVNVLAPQVPARVARSIKRALAKEPADRFETPLDFGISLDVPVEELLSQRRRSVRSRWARVGILIAVVIGAGLIAIKMLVKPELDPNRIVVFPMVAWDGGPTMSGAGRTVAIAIEVALDEAQPLKWIDGWDHMAESVRRDPLQFDAGVARSIAIDRQAGFYIDGVLRSEGDSMTVSVSLHDVERDVVVDRVAVRGPRDSTVVASLGLQAIVELLPSLVDPGRESLLPAMAGRAPSAIALFIRAEREYRTGRYAEASDLYTRALAEDSSLVLAAAKGAFATRWADEDETSKDLIDIALAGDTLLPARYAALARAIRAYTYGHGDSAVAYCRAALEIAPDWAEAMTWLGESYYHLLSSESPLDSLAEAAFTRAAELDTGFSPPLYHSAEIALNRGEIERADALIERLRDIDYDTSSLRKLTILRDCIRDGPEGIAWSEHTRNDPTTVLFVGQEASAGLRQPVCAERGFRAVLADLDAGPGNRWGAVMGLQGVLVAEGRYEEAMALLDSVETAGTSRALMLIVLDMFAGAPYEARANGVTTFAQELFGRYYERASSELQWLMGAWHARYRYDRLERITRNVQALAAETGDRKDALHAAALEGHFALARGDTAEAIALFDALQPTAEPGRLDWELSEPLAVERLLLAEVLLQWGDYQRAHDVATVFDHPQPIMFVPYVARSLAIRLRAAEALGDVPRVERYRQRLGTLGRTDLITGGL